MQLLKTHREKSKISLNFRVRGLTYITVCCSFLNSTDSAECWKISREICCSSLTKFQYCILRTSLIFLGSLPREFRHSLHLQIWNTKDPRLNDFVVQKKKKKKANTLDHKTKQQSFRSRFKFVEAAHGTRGVVYFSFRTRCGVHFGTIMRTWSGPSYSFCKQNEKERSWNLARKHLKTSWYKQHAFVCDKLCNALHTFATFSSPFKFRFLSKKHFYRKEGQLHRYNLKRQTRRSDTGAEQLCALRYFKNYGTLRNK